MPVISSIQDVKQAEDDAIVYAFRGTLKSHTKYYPADETDQTSQSMQIATFVDGKDSITVKFRNREAIPAGWKGKVIWCLAYKGPKGWSGVKAKDNVRDGNTERILLVTKSAEVGPNLDPNAGNGGNEEAPPARESAPESARPPAREGAPAPARQSAPSNSIATQPDDYMKQRCALATVRRFLAKSINAMFESRCAVEALADRLHKEKGIVASSEELHGWTTTFYIDLRRAFLVDELPVKATNAPEFAKKTTVAAPTKKAEPPKREPEPEPEPAPEPPAEEPPPSDDDVPF